MRVGAEIALLIEQEHRDEVVVVLAGGEGFWQFGDLECVVTLCDLKVQGDRVFARATAGDLTHRCEHVLDIADAVARQRYAESTGREWAAVWRNQPFRFETLHIAAPKGEDLYADLGDALAMFSESESDRRRMEQATVARERAQDFAVALTHVATLVLEAVRAPREADDAFVNLGMVEPEPANAIVDGLVYAGDFTLAVGDEGVAKSFTLQALSLHVTSGKPFAGRDVRQGAVLLLDGQLGARRLRDRFNRLANSFRYPAMPLVWDGLAQSIDLLSSGGRAALLRAARRAELMSGQKLALVVVDARDQFLSGADPGLPDTAEQLHASVRAFQRTFDPPPAFWVVVNFRKFAGGPSSAGLNFAAQRVAGSGRWKDLADVILSFSVNRTEGRRTIERITVWAAKDRDDRIEPLSIDIVNKDDAIIFKEADPDLIFFPNKGGRPSKVEACRPVIMEVLEGASGTSTRPKVVAVCASKGFGEQVANKALLVMEVAEEIKINKKKKPHVVKLRRKTA